MGSTAPIIIGDNMKFENVTVEIDEHRWYIRISITHPDGKEEVYFASSDAHYTSGDGIWFGTQEEYESY